MDLRKTSFGLTILAIAFMFLGGCGGQNVLQTLDETRVTYRPAPMITPGVEEILENIFTETGVAWDKQTVLKVASARNSLTSISRRMVDRKAVALDTLYYRFIADVEDIYYRILLPA